MADEVVAFFDRLKAEAASIAATLPPPAPPARKRRWTREEKIRAVLARQWVEAINDLVLGPPSFTPRLPSAEEIVDGRARFECRPSWGPVVAAWNEMLAERARWR